MDRSELRNNVTAELRGWWFNHREGVLFGNIHNDFKKRWKDGSFIHTSHVIKFHVVAQQSYVYAETLNSIYKLYYAHRVLVNKQDDFCVFQIPLTTV